jgi:hypothetical protein
MAESVFRCFERIAIVELQCGVYADADLQPGVARRAFGPSRSIKQGEHCVDLLSAMSPTTKKSLRARRNPFRRKRTGSLPANNWWAAGGTTSGSEYRSLDRFPGCRFWMLAKHIHRNDPDAVIVVISFGSRKIQPRLRLNGKETPGADRINRSVVILASMKLHRVSVHKSEALDIGSWGGTIAEN